MTIPRRPITRDALFKDLAPRLKRSAPEVEGLFDVLARLGQQQREKQGKLRLHLDTAAPVAAWAHRGVAQPRPRQPRAPQLPPDLAQTLEQAQAQLTESFAAETGLSPAEAAAFIKQVRRVARRELKAHGTFAAAREKIAPR